MQPAYRREPDDSLNGSLSAGPEREWQHLVDKFHEYCQEHGLAPSEPPADDPNLMLVTNKLRSPVSSKVSLDELATLALEYAREGGGRDMTLARVFSERNGDCLIPRWNLRFQAEEPLDPPVRLFGYSVNPNPAAVGVYRSPNAERASFDLFMSRDAFEFALSELKQASRAFPDAVKAISFSEEREPPLLLMALVEAAVLSLQKEQSESGKIIVGGLGGFNDNRLDRHLFELSLLSFVESAQSDSHLVTPDELTPYVFVLRTELGALGNVSAEVLDYRELAARD